MVSKEKIFKDISRGRTELVVVHEAVGLPVVLDIGVARLSGQLFLVLRLQDVLCVLGRNVRPSEHR